MTTAIRHPTTPPHEPPPPPTPPPTAVPASGGCAAALAHLDANAAPGFTFECPGYADGHDAMTCITEQGSCPDAAVIAIADACPQAYMNEASNAWVLIGRSNAPIDPMEPARADRIDPYGACPS